MVTPRTLAEETVSNSTPSMDTPGKLGGVTFQGVKELTGGIFSTVFQNLFQEYVLYKVKFCQHVLQ